MKIVRFFLIAALLLSAYVVALLAYLMPWFGLPLVVCILAALARKQAGYSACGTARWAEAADIPHMLSGGNGLILGHVAGKPTKLGGIKALFDRRLPAVQAVRRYLEACQRKQHRRLARLNTSTHTAVFAPTGVGKGVSCVIPFLLSNDESCVVVDFKGELARITADARRKMGHKVVLLDPYKVVTETPDSLNVLDYVDRNSPLAIDDIRDLAEALVVRTGMEKERHWDDNAELWIGAMAAFLVDFQKEVSLQGVKTLLADPLMMQTAIEKMKASGAWGGILARYAGELSHFRDKELSSVLTTANRHLRFLDTPAIAQSTVSSSFDPAELREGKMTVFMILPPDRMRAQSGLLRLWITAMFRAVIRGGLQDTHNYHFILDEAASLGRMEAVNDAIDKYRGYGIKLQLYFQSLGQLKLNFPEDQGQTLLSNTTQVYFGINDAETAEHVSKRLGEQTIIVNEGGSNQSTTHQPSDKGGQSSYSHGTSASWRQHGRPLLRPEEVTGLSPRIAITFSPGSPPLWTTLVRWYEGDFNDSRSIGLVKASVDAFCLFATAAIGAVFFTAAAIFGMGR